MKPKRAPTDAILARHWISHPAEPAYKVAKHVDLEPRTLQLAANRLRERTGTSPQALLAYLREHPIRSPKSISLRHPNASRWLKRTKIHFLLSGEDAAVIDGWDIVPNRHLVYVEEADLRSAVEDALDSGARLADASAANLTIRQKDPWLVADEKALVERGQRLIDYLESDNVQFLIQLRERMPEANP